MDPDHFYNSINAFCSIEQNTSDELLFLTVENSSYIDINLIETYRTVLIKRTNILCSLLLGTIPQINSTINNNILYILDPSSENQIYSYSAYNLASSISSNNKVNIFIVFNNNLYYTNANTIYCINLNNYIESTFYTFSNNTLSFSFFENAFYLISFIDLTQKLCLIKLVLDTKEIVITELEAPFIDEISTSNLYSSVTCSQGTFINLFGSLYLINNSNISFLFSGENMFEGIKKIIISNNKQSLFLCSYESQQLFISPENHVYEFNIITNSLVRNIF